MQHPPDPFVALTPAGALLRAAPGARLPAEEPGRDDDEASAGGAAGEPNAGQAAAGGECQAAAGGHPPGLGGREGLLRLSEVDFRCNEVPPASVMLIIPESRHVLRYTIAH